MNRAQVKLLEQTYEKRGREQGCVHLSYELEGKVVQRWDTSNDQPVPHQPPFRVLRIHPTKVKGYVLLDLEVAGVTKKFVSGFQTGDFYKVVG